MRNAILGLICVHLCSSVVASAEPPAPKFEPQTIDDKIRIGYGVVIGEVDGDGKPDILLADARQIVWYRNPGKAGAAWAKFVMAENLTQRDNVCIAARDINGDGKVEVAVGSNWNPGNTTDPEQSGAVFYLVRPDDPTQKWETVKIEPHEPTVHRMRWVRVGENKYQLAVLPLHGVGNRGGQGKAVNVLMYQPPADVRAGAWKLTRVDTGLHATHNFDVMGHEPPHSEELAVVGKEGYVNVDTDGIRWRARRFPLPTSAGEVRTSFDEKMGMVALIEPMHGNEVVVFIAGHNQREEPGRRVLDTTFSQGHALAVDRFVADGVPQVVAGWRMPNKDKKVGIKMYVPLDDKGEKWSTHWIDNNKMACEDIAVADLDGDGRLDLVASGRATRNVIVYWNRTAGIEGKAGE